MTNLVGNLCLTQRDLSPPPPPPLLKNPGYAPEPRVANGRSASWIMNIVSAYVIIDAMHYCQSCGFTRPRERCSTLVDK